MERSNIGLNRGTVRLVRHSEQWHQLFLKEKDRIQQTLGTLVLGVEHIGSTAICSIPAKPIIDIDLGTERLIIARKKHFRNTLQKLGYRLRHNKRSESLYVLGPESKRTLYLHVVRYKGRKWRNDLAFRDYVGNHKRVAERYTRLKERLAAQFPDDRASYARGKRRFIHRILQKDSQ